MAGRRVQLLIATVTEGLEPVVAAATARGFDVTAVRRLAEVQHAAETGHYDAVILDRSAAEELLGRLRRADPARRLVVWLPVASSARVADLLETGANEVLDATMGERELGARIQNALRVGSSLSERLDLGALTIDIEQGLVAWNGRDLPLSRRERDVLAVLAAAQGRTVRRETVYREVWGFAMARGDRTVDVNVRRIREKLQRAGATIRISTQAGVGYRLDDDIAAVTHL